MLRACTHLCESLNPKMIEGVSSDKATRVAFQKTEVKIMMSGGRWGELQEMCIEDLPSLSNQTFDER